LARRKGPTGLFPSDLIPNLSTEEKLAMSTRSSETVNDDDAIRSLEALAARLEALADALQCPAPEFYSIKQAAQVVSVSADHIRRAVTGGWLPASNVGTPARPTYRISRADLLAWVDQGKSGGVLASRRKVTPLPASRHHHRRAAGSGERSPAPDP
jgi:excisionase family DNA binding protein